MKTCPTTGTKGMYSILYAGYILGVLDDDYYQQCIATEANNIEMYRAMVDQRLAEWNISGGDAPFKLMVFNYFT